MHGYPKPADRAKIYYVTFCVMQFYFDTRQSCQERHKLFPTSCDVHTQVNTYMCTNANTHTHTHTYTDFHTHAETHTVYVYTCKHKN